VERKKLKDAKSGKYGKKISFTYFSAVVEHKNAGNIKIVFLKTSDNLIPIASTDLEINDEEIIEISTNVEATTIPLSVCSATL
jgi:hypothetical protein